MEDPERLGLSWPGKAACRRAIESPPRGALRPMRRESVGGDATENLVIEGDNLEVLRHLRATHGGAIKVCYIDPPYNAGVDGVYADRFRDHAAWLSMIYPRLALARALLRDDGVIFVSIGEEELAHLMVVMNEIFGEENRQGIICWRRRYNQPNDKTKMLARVAEWVVAYSKDARALKASGVGKVDLTGTFANPDGDARGPWATKPWKIGSNQSGSRYALTTPAGVVHDATWMGDESTYRALLADGRIVFPNGGRGAPRKKYFESERATEGQCATNWWSHETFGHNQGANSELARLFDGVKNVFTNPKPVALVRALVQVGGARDGDWVLDFFAGSGTTGHAVTALDAEDGARRRFVLVQQDEAVPEGAPARGLGLTTIPQILRERLRRAGAHFRALRHEPE
jgi:adenine-specific DNA-methyltransferase